MVWCQLFPSNIRNLSQIADNLHPDLPEREQVFAERLKLFPDGCLALVGAEGGEICGYVISHPILRAQPPALDSLLGKIASDADQYYIHDLVIVPELRGHGFTWGCISKILTTVAKRHRTTSLVSVYGTTSFWGRFGFVPEEVGEAMKKKLLEYGDDATYLERKNEE